MIALLLNSGLGSRMGEITKEHPKCMTSIGENETIVSRQLKLLKQNGIKDVVMTTGYFDDVLRQYCNGLKLGLNITYVVNPRYRETNYIYSIYCARDLLHDDVVIMHGDLVFSHYVLREMINDPRNTVAVSSLLELPEKDFKSIIKDGKISKIGVNFFDNAVASQPLYKIKKDAWEVWLSKIIDYCERGDTNCYAENAFNDISENCPIFPFDYKNELCSEIDNRDDLNRITKILKDMERS